MIRRSVIVMALVLMPSAAAGAEGPALRPELPANAAAVVAVGSGRLSQEEAASLAQLKQVFGLELNDAGLMSRLGRDPSRPAILATGIADPAAVERSMASPTPPASDTGFGTRMSLVLPVLDVDKATATMLTAGLGSGSCGRPAGPAKDWTAWLARLPSDAERRAARASGALYLCTDPIPVVARVNRDRRELQWIAALALHDPFTAALAPLPPAPALAARLASLGFFSVRYAAYTTPADQLRSITAVFLGRAVTSLAGVEAKLRPEMWRQVVAELAQVKAFLESPPRLFSDRLVLDEVTALGLTVEGESFFASLKLPAGTDRRRLHQEIQRRLKPGGVFASVQTLWQALKIAGHWGGLLGSLFVWPHALAMLEAHPELESEVDKTMPWVSHIRGLRGTVELDRQNHRLRLLRK